MELRRFHNLSKASDKLRELTNFVENLGSAWSGQMRDNDYYHLKTHPKNHALTILYTPAPSERQGSELAHYATAKSPSGDLWVINPKCYHYERGTIRFPFFLYFALVSIFPVSSQYLPSIFPV